MTKKKTKTINYGLSIARKIEGPTDSIEILPPTKENLEKANSFFTDFPEEASLLEQMPQESLFF